MKRYVSEKQISEITGKAVQTLRNERHMMRGFPYVKLGKMVRYDVDEVIALMEERKIRPDR